MDSFENHLKSKHLTREHVTTCALLSKACYIINPIEYLNNELTRYSLDIEKMIPIDQSDSSVHHFIMAVSEKTKTLYLAFRGTDNYWDILTDISFIPTTSEVEGSFHRGFVKRSNSVRIDLFVEQYLKQGFRIICCGHSLGGSVAAMVAIRLIKSHNHSEQEHIFCMGFGSPMFGSSLAKEKLANCEDQFIWFVNPRDVVPASLFLLKHLGGNTSNTLQVDDSMELQQAMISEKGSLVDQQSLEKSWLSTLMSKISNSIPSVFSAISGLVQTAKDNKLSFFTIIGLIWKIIVLAAPKIKSTVGEILKHAIKSSEYVMIGKFFTFEKNLIVSFENEEIYTSLDNVNEIISSINGHRMIHYLNNLNPILVTSNSAQKRNIELMNEFTITEVQPYLGAIVSVTKENEQVKKQQESNDILLYYISNMTSNSFVVNLLGNHKLSNSVTCLTSSRNDIVIKCFNNEESYSSENRFKVTSKNNKQFTTRDQFIFKVYYWFGNVEFKLPLSFVRSAESKNAEKYTDMDPITLLFKAYQFVHTGRISNNSDTVKDLETLCSENGIKNLRRYCSENSVEALDFKHQKSILVDLSKMIKNFSEQTNYLLYALGGIGIAGVLVGGTALAIIFLPGALAGGAVASVTMGNTLVVEGFLTVKAILAACAFFGMLTPTSILIQYISDKYTKEIQLYCEVCEMLLKVCNEDIAGLRREKGFYFHKAEQLITTHHHRLQLHEKDIVKKAEKSLQLIHRIRNDMIAQPVQVGIYSTLHESSELVYRKMLNTPLFRFGHDLCFLQVIPSIDDENELVKLKNSYYDLVILVFELYELYQDDWSTKSTSLVSQLSGVDDFLICINVPNNTDKQEVSQVLNRKLDAFKNISGVGILINFENPNISEKIMSHEYVYSYILDHLSKENCEKYSFINFIPIKVKVFGTDIVHNMIASNVNDILSECKNFNTQLDTVYEESSLTLLNSTHSLIEDKVYIVSTTNLYQKLKNETFSLSRQPHIYIKFDKNERKKKVNKPETMEKLIELVQNLKTSEKSFVIVDEEKDFEIDDVSFLETDKCYLIEFQ